MYYSKNNIKFSVIIPIYNEARIIENLVKQINILSNQGAEVIVVDGGSTDETVMLLKKHDLNFISSQKGRALQMNCGVAQAKGNILIFLHADTILPHNSIEILTNMLKNTNKLWGRFDVKIESEIFMLKIVSRMINLRSRVSGIATGDQAIFIAKDLFWQLGGFPKQKLMEDIELSKQLKIKKLKPLCLKHKVLTSGRRWEQYGVWTTIFLMWKLRWRYWRNIPIGDEYK